MYDPALEFLFTNVVYVLIIYLVDWSTFSDALSVLLLLRSSKILLQHKLLIIVCARVTSASQDCLLCWILIS
jgi:hypothetical protein